MGRKPGMETFSTVSPIRKAAAGAAPSPRASSPARTACAPRRSRLAAAAGLAAGVAALLALAGLPSGAWGGALLGEAGGSAGATLVTSHGGRFPRGEDLPRAGRGQFAQFLEDLKAAADAKQVPVRPIEFLFGPGSFALSCDGLWAEFGVFDGGTLTLAANWRAAHCGPDAPPVFGFDTFSGLPEAWEQGAGGDTFEPGAFDLAGKLPAVPANARLVRGLFADTLPPFLMELRGGADHAALVGKAAAASASAAAAAAGRKAGPPTPTDAASHVNPSGAGAAGHAPGRAAAYVHIDCDLYAGARDALAALSPLIRPGTVLVFDDLINYAAYREHEVKALWEWLASTGLHVRVVGVKGPLPGAAGAGGAAMELEPTTRHPHHQQSVAFVVV